MVCRGAAVKAVKGELDWMKCKNGIHRHVFSRWCNILSGRLICIDYGVVRGWAKTCIHLEKHVCVNIKIIHCQSYNFLMSITINFWDSLQKDRMQKGPLLWILHYSTYDVASPLAKLVSLKRLRISRDSRNSLDTKHDSGAQLKQCNEERIE